MKRRIATLAVLVALSLPGCANRKALGIPYALGTIAMATGLVLAADGAMNPTQCEMALPGEEDPDWFCLGAFTQTYVDVMAPLSLATAGWMAIAGTVFVHWYSIWRENRGATVAADTKN